MDDPLALRLAEDLDGTFEALVRAHQDRLYGLALRSLGDPRDAEELTQDAFVRAYRALAGYDHERRRTLAIRPWLSTIVLNLCRNRVRRAPRRPSVGLEQLEAAGRPLAADQRETPEAGLLRAEGSAALSARLAALPARYREPLLLRYVDDLAYAEMAIVLSAPEGTLRARVHRGLSMLRAATFGSDLESSTLRPQEVLA